MHEVQRHTAPHVRVVTPSTLDDALALVGQPSIRVLAGGSDLLIELERGLRPDVTTLLDITRIGGLDRIEEQGDRITLGPLVTHASVVSDPIVRERAWPLAQAAWEIGSPQLRNRATVVGNLVTASPANDTITPLRVLDAELDLSSVRGVRTVTLDAFHTGVRSTLMAPDELVSGVRFRALRPGERAVYVKAGNRRAQAISVVHLTLRMQFDGEAVVDAEVAIGSVAPTVVTLRLDELIGNRPTPDRIRAAARAAAAAVSPIDDVRATATHRTDQVAVMVERAVRALVADTPPRLPTTPITLASSTVGRRRGGHDHGPDDPVHAMVNGTAVTAPAAVPATLLDWLRGGVGLTGTKEGCAEGECGACTVIVDGSAVMSCLAPSTVAHGSEITTVEGLAGADGLHPIQEAFVDATAVQCGYCIPGFVVAAAALLEERPSPTDGEIADALAGNLCRCTGYYPIVDAVRRAAGHRP